MAKRRQTTGLPKVKKETSSGEDAPARSRAGLAREYRSRAERESEIQRLVILGTGITIAVVAVILAISFVVAQVINPRRTVATIYGQDITVSDFQKRVRLERFISIQRINEGINAFLSFGFTSDPNEAFSQLLSNDPDSNRRWNELNIGDQMGIRVLEDMILDALIRREAEQRGITVTDEQIQREIDRLFNFNRDELVLDPEATAEVEPTTTPTPTPLVSPTPTPEPTATSTPEVEPTATVTPFPTVAPPPTLSPQQQLEDFESTVNRFYSQARNDTGLSNTEIRRYFEGLALRNALRDALFPSDGTTLYANVRHILVQTEEEAQDVLQALNNGESFATLASAVSQDRSDQGGSAQRGGELGWAPVSNYVEPFAEAVRNAAIGEIVGPVQSDFGYHIIQVRGRENREVSELQIEREQETQFTEWLDELRLAQAESITTNSIWTDFVPNDPLFVYRPR